MAVKIAKIAVKNAIIAEIIVYFFLFQPTSKNTVLVIANSHPIPAIMVKVIPFIWKPIDAFIAISGPDIDRTLSTKMNVNIKIATTKVIICRIWPPNHNPLFLFT